MKHHVFGMVLFISMTLSGCAIFSSPIKPPLPAEIKNQTIAQWSTVAMCFELLPVTNEKQLEQIFTSLIEQFYLSYADRYTIDDTVFYDVLKQVESKAMARLAQKDSLDVRQAANYCKTQLMTGMQKIDLQNQRVRLERERERLQAEQSYLAYQQIIGTISDIAKSSAQANEQMMQINRQMWNNMPKATFGEPSPVITNCRTAGGMTSCSSRERDPTWRQSW